VSAFFSHVNCACELKNAVFSAMFKYGKQETNIDSRKILTAEDLAAPAVTRYDSSEDGSGLQYNVA